MISWNRLSLHAVDRVTGLAKQISEIRDVDLLGIMPRGTAVWHPPLQHLRINMQRRRLQGKNRKID
jgi:hypothetical protein